MNASFSPTRRAAALCALTLAAACTSGLPEPVDTTPPTADEPAPNSITTLGFSLGMTLVDPTGSSILANPTYELASNGAVVAGLALRFVAFTTRAAADDGDGQGTPIDPEAPADPDRAGASSENEDVFLAAFDGSGTLLDAVLVSQIQSGGTSGAKRSRAPSIAFVTPASGGGADTQGSVFVAFESDADNLVPGDSNTRRDVVRATIDVDIAGGVVDLVFRSGANILISINNSASNGGNGDSTDAVVSASGKVVSFASTAPDLVAADVNGVSDVFRRDLTLVTTTLVSFNPIGAVKGNAASRNPALSSGSSGEAIAFESDASNLAAGDTNGVRDVFYARIDTSDGSVKSLARASLSENGSQATGGASRNASLYVVNASGVQDKVLVAFESDAVNLVADLPPGVATSVYLFDSRNVASGVDVTRLLAQRIDASGATLGSAADGAASGNSFAPSFSSDGAQVVFETECDNLDPVHPDGNGVRDIVSADLTHLSTSGHLLIRRISQASDGGDPDGASTTAALGRISGAGGAAAATSFADGLAQKFLHQRCINCHGFNAGNSIGVLHADNGWSTCSNCHTLGLTGVTTWTAPPAALSFANKTLDELCAQAKDPGNATDAFEHLTSDDKILWALTDGDLPAQASDPTAELVPGGLGEWTAQVTAWRDAGYACRTFSSASGDYVSYASDATNLGPGNAEGDRNWFAFPERAPFERLSKTSGYAPDGGAQLDGDSSAPSVTRDDRYVAFETTAALSANDTNGASDVYVRDLYFGTTTLVSRASGQNRPADGASGHASAAVDDNGVLHVAFESSATNLVAGFVDGNGEGLGDVYLASFTGFDGTHPASIDVELVSRKASNASKGGDRSSVEPALAAQGGLRIAFTSMARDLIAGFEDGNGAHCDVFRATIGGGMELVSASITDPARGGDGDSHEPAIADDGSLVAFKSDAGDLVAGFDDHNGVGCDVFLCDLSGPSTVLVSRSTASSTDGGDGDSSAPSLNLDGSVVAFESRATDLVAGFADHSGSSDVFLFDLGSGATELISARDGGSPTHDGDAASLRPHLSVDGDVVVFESSATNLVADDSNDLRDVFARVRSAGTTTLISRRSGVAANGSSTRVRIGSVGGEVVFQSGSSNLVFASVGVTGEVDTNSASDVYRATQH